MKQWFYILLAAVMISIPVLSQDKEEDDDRDEDNSRYSTWTRSKLGGAGGVTPMIGMFDNAELDRFLTKAGMPTFGSEPTYLIGGEGYGYIMFLRNVRMGGFGVSGQRTVNTVQPMANDKYLKKEVEYMVSYGGFLMDYVQPVANRLDIAIGASIGGGNIDLTLTRDDGSFKQWDSMWVAFGDTARTANAYKQSITGTFVTFTPHISIEYTILSWLQIRIGAGYPMMFSQEWKLDDMYDVTGVPSGMKLKGYTVNAGIMFGFFGW